MRESTKKELFERIFKPECIKHKNLGMSKQESLSRVTMARLICEKNNLFSKEDIDWRESESKRIIEEVYNESVTVKA